MNQTPEQVILAHAHTTSRLLPKAAV